MTSFRLVQRAPAEAPLVLLYLVGEQLDPMLAVILPGIGIAARVDAPLVQGRADIDLARSLTGAHGRLVLCGYSAGCQSVRSLLLAGVEAAAVLTIDGTHASVPPAAWQIDVWRTLAAEARRGEIVWGASCTQMSYVERIPEGQPGRATSTRHVLEAAIGAELPAGAEVHESGLHVYSYPSADVDKLAHERQQTEALPRLLRSHIAPLFLGHPDTDPAPEPEPTPESQRATIPSNPTPAGLGERALEVAVRELGVREVPPGSNRGPRVDEYLRPTGLQGVAWCAAFASWCDREGGGGAPGPFGYPPAVAGLWRAAVTNGHALPSTAEPERGWLAIFARAGSDPRQGGEGHVGRVESWDAETLTTVDGNVGDAVTRVTRPRSAVLGWCAYEPAVEIERETAGRLLALADALDAGLVDGAALDAVETSG